MTNRFRVSAAIFAAVAGSLVGSANAEVILTLTYDDLAGSFTASAPRAGNFSAVAVNTGTLQSAGEVSRLGAGAGSASFEAGFVSNPFNPADFQLNINVAPLANPNQASGLGSFTATDADGDTITGDISGTWAFGGPGFIFFNGSLNNVTLHDNGGADNSFDGTESGDFGMNYTAPQPYEGAIVQLVFGGSNFFRTSFADRATNINMQVVPTPGSVALLGLGGLAMASRRRSR